jgi:3-oxoacyl-[acyl-carrier protein] reductase
MINPSLRLDYKKILITGVSRPSGIGATLARRFTDAGATVAIHGCSDYDMKSQYVDAKEDATDDLANELTREGKAAISLTSSDLSQADMPKMVMAEANRKIGSMDGLVLNHAFSTHAPIGEWTCEHIDAHLLVNVRASMLMIQAFAEQIEVEKGGVITLFTSGQYLGPMTSEIAYAVSKDAIIGLCKQVSVALAAKNIRVNCINPGPNDTKYSVGEEYEFVRKLFPTGRWGTPNDTADLALFLHSDYAKWITGQVIASEGGFRRTL